MTLRTCLLISDDPDDQHNISEAISEISEKTIVLNILDSKKALLLLTEGKFEPDFVFLDLSMPGVRINSLLTILKDEDGFLKRPTIVYGDQSSLSQVNDQNLIPFSKDYTYSELKFFLSTIF